MRGACFSAWGAKGSRPTWVRSQGQIAEARAAARIESLHCCEELPSGSVADCCEELPLGRRRQAFPVHAISRQLSSRISLESHLSRVTHRQHLNNEKKIDLTIYVYVVVHLHQLCIQLPQSSLKLPQSSFCACVYGWGTSSSHLGCIYARTLLEA